jgi:hypothetical protein
VVSLRPESDITTASADGDGNVAVVPDVRGGQEVRAASTGTSCLDGTGRDDLPPVALRRAGSGAVAGSGCKRCMPDA